VKFAAPARVTLRPAEEADLGFLWDLQESTMRPYIEATWGWDEAWQRQHFRRFKDPARIQIVELEGRAIGSIGLERYSDHIYVGAFQIEPAHQNRGIGTQLLRDVLADAKRADLPVKLQVLKMNPAKRLYERLGFSVSDETDTHFEMRHDRIGQSNP
jgi:ribosomal protein S18 acetylase RimI-like enzyme